MELKGEGVSDRIDFADRKSIFLHYLKESDTKLSKNDFVPIQVPTFQKKLTSKINFTFHLKKKKR